MKSPRLTLSRVSLGLLAVAVAATSAAAATVHKGGIVMGTVLRATVVAVDNQTAQALANEAFDIAIHWDAVLTTWHDNGELKMLNATAGHGSVVISDDLHRALSTMTALSAATAGAFDPAVGPLVERLRRGSGPSATPIDASLPRYHIASALSLSPRHAELIAHAALDAGGIGKGIALDAIAKRLRNGGASAAFLDFGGSSQLAFGKPENDDSWWVALSANGADAVLGALVLRDAALSTSRALAAGNRAGSIIDPRAMSVVEPPRLATVIATDATTAEAWSTALIVLGSAGIPQAQAADIQALIQQAGDTSITQGFPLHTQK